MQINKVITALLWCVPAVDLVQPGLTGAMQGMSRLRMTECQKIRSTLFSG